MTLSAPLLALCREIDARPEWRAGPLAFVQIVRSVVEFQPTALKLVDDLGFQIVAQVLNPPPGGPKAGEAGRSRLEDSRIYNFLVARNRWRETEARDPGAVRSVAGKNLLDLLPAGWTQPPPDVWIGMCGSSASGKTSIYSSLFQFHLDRPGFFQGLSLTPTADLFRLLGQADVEATLMNSFVGMGRLSHSGQRMFFADIKGGNLDRLQSAQDIAALAKEAPGRRPGGQPPTEAPSPTEAFGVDDLAQRADLLVLTLAPDEVANVGRLREVTARLCRAIGASDRKYAMIAVVFTKADDYGLGTPGLQRLCFQESLARGDGAWGKLQESVPILNAGSDAEILRDKLLGIVKDQLWQALVDNRARGGREPWKGAFGVYLLSPLPEDPAYLCVGPDGRAESRWDATGVATLFRDFFAHYQPPKEIRPMSALLLGLLSKVAVVGGEALRAVRPGARPG
jgi:hypothetical protein